MDRLKKIKLEELKSKAKNLCIDILECGDNIVCIENKITEFLSRNHAEDLRNMINEEQKNKNLELE